MLQMFKNSKNSIINEVFDSSMPTQFYFIFLLKCDENRNLLARFEIESWEIRSDNNKKLAQRQETAK